MTDRPPVVEQYLAAVVAFDWLELENALEPDVVRVGPFGDTYTGRGAYVAFLSALMPTLVDYSMDVHRIVDAGRVVTAELTETMTWDGERVVTHEALVFDVTANDRIRRIAIYIQPPSTTR
jgi:limonene-1,2-epoxide hydrolase